MITDEGGLVVDIEAEEDRDAGAIRPTIGVQVPTRADLVHRVADFLLGPIPRWVGIGRCLGDAPLLASAGEEGQ